MPWSLGWLALLVVGGLPSIVRVVTGASFAVSAAITGVVIAPAIFALLRRMRRPTRDDRTAALVGIGLGALAAWAMYTPWFRGAVCITGTPDAGHHALYMLEFLDEQPHVYGDFVLLYGLVAWFRHLPHFGVFIGFTAVFYATILGLIACFGELAVAWAREGRGLRGRRVAIFGAPLVVAAAAHGAILVQLHYYHAEGFYPQIYGLVVVMLIWLADVALDDGVCKVLVLLAGGALVRYTYGLNLPDLCLALAIVLLDGRRGFRDAQRALVTIAGALVFLYIGWRAAVAISAYYLKWGPFIPYDVNALAIGEALLVACLVPSLRERDEAQRRRFRFPLVFAAINVCFFAFAKRPTEHLDYYYLKTSFQPFFLVLVAAGVAALRGVARAVDERRLARALGYAIVFAFGLGAGSYATRMWRDKYIARIAGHPPFIGMWPLFDPNAQLHIDSVLAQRHEKFGGYLTSFYPTMNFMNAANGFWNGGIAFYYGRPPDTARGHCVFWEGGPDSSHLEGAFPQEHKVRALDSYSGKTCTSYRPTWDPRMRRTLCWTCY